MKLVVKMVVLLLVVSCTTNTVNINGTMNRAFLIPVGDVEVAAASSPNNSTSENIKEIKDNVVDFEEKDVKSTVTTTTKVIAGDDKSKEHTNNSDHTTDVDTDIQVKNRNDKKHE